MNHLDAFDERPFTPPAATGYCARCRTDCTRTQPCPHCENQRHVERHDLPRDVLESYRRRVPGANDPAVYDATAQYAHHLLRHWLEIACAVMQDEGVDARTRHRVLAAVAYVSVSPPDIIQRDRMRAETAQVIAEWPPTMRVTAEGYEDLIVRAGLPKLAFDEPASGAEELPDA